MFKKIKESFIKREEEKIRKKYEPILNQMESQLQLRQTDLETRRSRFDEMEREVTREIDEREKELKSKRDDMDSLLKRVQDRKEELAHENEELKHKLRMIEAKGKPESVWVQAFSAGYSKAWDSMLPIMLDGINKIKETIRTQTIEESRKGIEPIVKNRIDQLQNVRLKETYHIVGKRNEIKNILQYEKDPIEREKLSNFLSALEWAINGNDLQKNKS